MKLKIFALAMLAMMVACQSKQTESTEAETQQEETMLKESADDSSEAIRAFYVAYMQGAGNVDALWMAHIPQETAIMLNEYADETDADGLTRAQDVSDYAIESLAVKSLGQGWYMVSYQWDAESEPIRIPLKVMNEGPDFEIIYVTPEWLGAQYGDELLPDYAGA